MIIERMEEYGIKIDKLVNCGGIAEKNPMVMQIYADILGKPMEVAASGQTVALGAAIIGGFVAMKGEEGFGNIEEIQSRVYKVKETNYTPDKKEHEVYMQIYELYKTIHDAFGVKGYNESLYNIMKFDVERSSFALFLFLFSFLSVYFRFWSDVHINFSNNKS